MIAIHARTLAVLIFTCYHLHLYVLIHLFLKIYLSCSKKVMGMELVMQLVDLLMQVLIVFLSIS